MPINPDIPNGFKPVRHLNGSPWNGQTNTYFILASNATATYVGDAVRSGGSADTLGQYATVEQAIAGDRIRGIITAFGNTPQIMANTNDLAAKYRKASVAMYCSVVDDPNVIFEAQEDGVTTPIAAASVGINVDLVSGGGSTATGASGMELDSDSGSGTATAQFRVLNLVRSEDNQLGTNARWQVLINEHEFKSAQGQNGK